MASRSQLVGTLSLAVAAAFSVACGNHEPDASPDPRQARVSGQLRVIGVLTSEGVECPALRARDGSLYTLAGNTGSFQVGDTVLVVGRAAEVSTCMQGTTIAVDSIARAR